MSEEQTNNVPTEVKKTGMKKYGKPALWILLIAGLCYGTYHFFFNGSEQKEETVTTDTTIVVNEVSPDSAVKVVVDTTKNDSVK